MAIYIQKIKTNWTKSSRGNPGATLRNKVPEKLPIVAKEFSDSVFLQQIVFEEGAFTKPNRKGISIVNETQIREHRLEFNPCDNGLEVGFWTENNIKKKVGLLRFNSWCQVKTNKRFPMEYTWGYYKIVYNIFYGEMQKAEEIVKTKTCEIEKDYQSLLW